jgi:tetratricopeptide (TPR) repeat protein
VNRVHWFVGLVIAVTAAFAWPQDLPSELKHLESIAGDPIALVDTARRFHLQQQDLIAWDRKMIDQYGRQEQFALVEEKQRELSHRVQLLESQWKWILARYPNDARANNYYGEFLFDYVGDEAAGLRHWLTAVELDDTCAPAHNNLGIHYFHTGNYAEGLKHLQRALALDENSPDYLYNMAQMYLIHFDVIERLLEMPREKLYKEAMRMSKKASELAPGDFDIVQDYAVNFYAAENFGIAADWTEAAAAWQRTLPTARTEDERFYVLLNEGRAWMRSAQPQNAVKPLEEALALNEESDVAQELLAKARGEPR